MPPQRASSARPAATRRQQAPLQTPQHASPAPWAPSIRLLLLLPWSPTALAAPLARMRQPRPKRHVPAAREEAIPQLWGHISLPRAKTAVQATTPRPQAPRPPQRVQPAALASTRPSWGLSHRPHASHALQAASPLPLQPSRLPPACCAPLVAFPPWGLQPA